MRELAFDLEPHADEAAWLEARKVGLGSSDAPSCLGAGFLTPVELWGVKTGKLEGPPPSLRFRFGHYAEQFIHAETVRELRTELADPGDFTICRSRSNPALFATPDRAVLKPGTAPPRAPAPHLAVLRAFRRGQVIGGASLKTVTKMAHRLSWPEGQPSRYALLQAQHEMFVLDLDEVWISALVGAGEELVVYHVPRDEVILGELLEAEHRMLECIRQDIPPPPDDDERTAKALGRIFPTSQASVVRQLKTGLGVKYLRWQKLKRLEKKLAKMRRGIENEFKVELRDAELGEFTDLPGAGISWKTQPGYRKLPVTDETLERLRAEHPELAEELTYQQGTSRVLREATDEEE